ncbi:MAG: SAVED domain-containing protein [Chloroflexota bacterium]|nr:SAVED domain-containing protein [Chloroflexota bacterium]
MASSGRPLIHQSAGQHRRADPRAAGVDPRGPVFISYRQSDGTRLANEIAWSLRAVGVPVWHDKSDLLPGDTEHRLEQALHSGLSGAALLVTPEIESSHAVQAVELPLLLELERNPAFTFSLLSALEREPGKLDYDAPDRLLAQPEGTLKRLKQQSVRTAQDRAAAAREQCERRTRAISGDIRAAGGIITIDVQTRFAPASAPIDADLVLRLRPPLANERRPNRLALEDLALSLEALPNLLALSGARSARFLGGAHLSVAYALGASLPTTAIGAVDVIDTAGQSWTLSGNAPVPEAPPRLLGVDSISSATAGTGPVLVYLDLLPAPSSSAAQALLSRNGNSFAAAYQIRPSRQGNLNPGEAGTLAGEVSQIIRTLAATHRTREVHLLLRCPWAIALLVGRTLNTLRIQLYEWEDGPDDEGNATEPRYLPSLAVRSGTGGSAIEQVLLPAHPTK